MLQTIFFDLGGIIFQDFFSGGEVLFAQELGLPAKTVHDAYVKTDVAAYCKNQLSDEGRWKLFVTEVKLPETKVQTCIQEFYKSYQLFSESATFLKELQTTRHYKLGVLSDQPMGVTKYLRKEYQDIFKLFTNDLILISAEIGLSKKDPDLEIYKEAIKKSGDLADQILFVDNSLHNVENAKSLGMQTYFFDIKHKSIEALLKELKQEINLLSK